MRYAAEDEEEPPALRRLRVMVMVLIVVLILGIVTIAATIVIRLGFGGGVTMVEAPSFTLPEGEITGLGRGEGSVLIVVRGADGIERLHVFDQASGGAPLSVSVVKRE